MIARWGGAGDGPSLLVNCHLDTHAASVGTWVDPFTGDTLTSWSEDPFAATIKDGNIFGRGTADHKSPIAATLMALEALEANGVRLRGRLTCIHDADEETGGGLGMAALVERMPFDFDMALYACTSGFTPMGREFFSAMGEDNIIRAFAGTQAYRLRFEGQNLHSLTPKRGLGAMEAVLIFLDTLRPYMERVNATVDPLEGTGQPILRVSAVDCSARSASHHQARAADLYLTRRISPGVDPAVVVEEMNAIVAAHNRDYPSNRATFEVVRSLPPVVTPADHAVVTGLASSVREVMGREPSIVGLPSPVGISTVLAKVPIPTVLFGYGYVNLHHAIDERIAIDALVDTAKVYAAAFMEWLGVAQAA